MDTSSQKYKTPFFPPTEYLWSEVPFLGNRIWVLSLGKTCLFLCDAGDDEYNFISFFSFYPQFYLVMKGHGKEDTRNGPGKFVAGKLRAAHQSLSNQSNPGLGGPAAIGLLGPLNTTTGNGAGGGINGSSQILPNASATGITLATASLTDKEIQVSRRATCQNSLSSRKGLEN